MMQPWFTDKIGRYDRLLTAKHNQRGSTLLVAMVMLILLTLMAIAAINSTTSSIQVVGNAQFREEANAAAQQAIEKVISKDFTKNPTAAATAASTTVSFGAASYSVTVATPTCFSSIAVTNAELNRNVAADKPCFARGVQGQVNFDHNGKPIPAGQSWCNKQKWDIRATATDDKTKVDTTLHQGVFIRVPEGTGTGAGC